MKKIICLLLALTCVFALFSCGEDKSLETFINLVEGSSPTRITTQTYIPREGDIPLEGEFITEIDGENFTLTGSYMRPATLEDMASSNTVTVPVQIYYKDGKYSVDNENWTTSVPDEATMQVKFNLDPAYLGNYVISQDGKTLITSLSAENAKEVLGLEITSLVGEVSLTVSNNGTYLTGLTIMYTITINGAESQVVIDTSYTYSPVVSDDANDETDGEGAEE